MPNRKSDFGRDDALSGHAEVARGESRRPQATRGRPADESSSRASGLESRQESGGLAARDHLEQEHGEESRSEQEPGIQLGMDLRVVESDRDRQATLREQAPGEAGRPESHRRDVLASHFPTHEASRKAD